ncbi:hypothetical protein [Amniculibacterium aquaticum]|uniref:hypothetical protein n=1 Tax=Amniculibacterium aquaticum TaxID=2479858 RepID=UPI000F5B6DDE|nr:hypothetical protein [Amniculibacterium aquaticum]
MNEIKKGDRTTAVWQNGGFSAKFNGSSSIELLYKTEHLCFEIRHFAKLQNVIANGMTILRTLNRQPKLKQNSKPF